MNMATGAIQSIENHPLRVELVCHWYSGRPSALRLSRRDYRRFFEALGFCVFGPPASFNPLTCEIVHVGNWPSPEEGIRIGGCFWPGLRFGEMVFSRCAVNVFCHPSHGVVEGIADRSTLYFTNYRMRRDCSDLSHGWGSNSQWATNLSRNYEAGG